MPIGSSGTDDGSWESSASTTFAPQIGPEFVPADAEARTTPAKKSPGVPTYPAFGRARVASFLGLAIISGLLAVWLLGLWVHGLGAVDRALYGTASGTYHWAESFGGAVYFHSEQDPNPIRRGEPVFQVQMGDHWSDSAGAPPELAGAGYRGVTAGTIAVGKNPVPVRYVAISYWLLAIVTSLPALMGIWQFRRLRARLRLFRCEHCGHTLRGSPFRCPDCGMPGPLAAHRGA